MQRHFSTAARPTQTVLAGIASFALLASLHVVSAAGAISSVATLRTLADSVVSATSSVDEARVPKNVRLYRTRTSLLGTHRWYRQVKDHRTVVGGWWGWHKSANTGRVTTWDGRRNVAHVNVSTPMLSADNASGVAAKALSSAPTSVTARRLMILATEGRSARLVWCISSADGRGARTAYIDAVDGAVLKTMISGKFSRSHNTLAITGRARVFDPNPVQKLQDESLRDHHDAATAVPRQGYTTRRLAHLNTSHSLAGRWARVMNADRATSRTDTYTYKRSNKYFEQTMAYYAVDVEQSYLRRLGFADVNAEAQKIETNTFAADNSYYDPSTDMITMGRGGVDDAEDPEVTWHEYGHAIQDDQVPHWGIGGQAGAIGEGFGDYMAVTMSQSSADDTDIAPTACVMDWDATSYTSTRPHCLRRTDGQQMYPDDLTGEVHADGEIWSSSLYAMNTGKGYSLGRNKATKIIVEAQFWMTPRVGFEEAAQMTVDTAQALYPDEPDTALAVRSAFAARGIDTVISSTS